jgi:hypothetical protein
LDNNPSSPARPSFADIPRSVLVSGIGAIVLLVSVFLNWYSATVSVSGGLAGFGGRSASASGWDTTDVAKLVALLALVAIAAWAIELFVPDVTLPVPAWMIAGGAGALAVLLVLFRIISKPHGAHSTSISLPNVQIHVDVGTSFGIWLALVAAIATVAGAYLRMNEPA